MINFRVAFVWAGGALFVSALAYCAYSYGFTWGRGTPFETAAIGVDALLFSAFALHHSVFARESIKRRMAAVIDDPLLRSVYVWVASALLIVTCAAWQPIGGELYRHSGVPAVGHAALQLAGLAFIVQSVRAIDALELAGIHQPSISEPLQTSGPYGLVRHPIYTGWFLLTFGAAHMTGDRLFFAGIAAAYLLIAMPFEERSLLRSFGDGYAEYRRVVRYRLVPYVY